MGDLHTKYRPAEFDEVVGQEATVKSIRKVLKEGNAHSFILTGPPGTGKTTIARIIAAKVGCDRKNLLEVDAASNTGIEAMRNVTEGLMYAPLGGGRAKVVIIDEAHALSKPAWQSLLKPVEEPPAHVYWVFCTTEPTKIPEAIRTRCASYETKPVATDTILELLNQVAKKEKLDTPEDVVYLIAEKAEGSPRRALVNLAKCSACTTRKEAAALIKASSEEGEVVDLCRLLMKGATWAQALECVKPLKDMGAEGIRLTVVGYLTAVLLGTKDEDKAGRLLEILDAFSTPYPQGAGIAHVLLSLGQVCLGE